MEPDNLTRVVRIQVWPRSFVLAPSSAHAIGFICDQWTGQGASAMDLLGSLANQPEIKSSSDPGIGLMVPVVEHGVAKA